MNGSASWLRRPASAPTSTSGRDAQDSVKTAEILQGGPTTSVPEYIAGAVRRLAPTSETDSTRDKSDLDIATRNALSGEVFLITMNDGQLQNMT